MPEGQPSTAPEDHGGAGQKRKSGEQERPPGQNCDGNGNDRGRGHHYRDLRPQEALEKQKQSGQSEKQGCPAEHLRPPGVEGPGGGERCAPRKSRAPDESGGGHRRPTRAEAAQKCVDSSCRLASGAGAEPGRDDSRRNQQGCRRHGRHERRVAKYRQEGRVREEGRKRGARA